jgi:hypothetical protein
VVVGVQAAITLVLRVLAEVVQVVAVMDRKQTV